MHDIIISVSSEKSLSGVLHEPVKKNNGKLLIISHGFRGSKEGGGHAVILAENACSIGYHVLRFDFSPQSRLSIQIAELRAVMQYMQKVCCLPIVLMGRSMGGCASLVCAVTGSKICGLCLWATPWNLHQTFRFALGEEQYSKLCRGKSIRIEDAYGKIVLDGNFIKDLEKYNLLNYIEKMRQIPLLVVHGTKDNIVPVEQAYETYAAASTASKEITVITGDDHHLHSGQAADVVLSWLAKIY